MQREGKRNVRLISTLWEEGKRVDRERKGVRLCRATDQWTRNPDEVAILLSARCCHSSGD